MTLEVVCQQSVFKYVAGLERVMLPRITPWEEKILTRVYSPKAKFLFHKCMRGCVVLYMLYIKDKNMYFTCSEYIWKDFYFGWSSHPRAV